METKTCQHCGNEIGPRAKNCSTCSALLQEAHRSGTYAFVMEAIATAKIDGFAGSDMHDAMRAAINLGLAKLDEFADIYRAMKTQRLAERKAWFAKRYEIDDNIESAGPDTTLPARYDQDEESQTTW